MPQANATSANAAGAAFVTVVEHASRLAGGVAVLALAAIAALMLAEVFVRNLFDRSLHITWELSAYSMGAVFFLAAPAAMLRGEHVRVGILFDLLGPRSGRILDAAATLASLAVACYVAYALGGLAWRSFIGDVRSWSGYRFPLSVPQAIICIGATLLALQLAARFVRLVTGRTPEERIATGAEVDGESGRGR